MKTSDLKQRLQTALTDFLWDQWAALGMAGHASGRPVPFIIDPEALLLTTLRFAIEEDRFREAVLDWLKHNGALLSVQRIKNLQANCHIADKKHLHGIAAFMKAQGFRNWKSLASSEGPNTFTDFSQHTQRGMSQAPDPHHNEAFILKLRLLFGVNARVEILTWLLTHSEGHASSIARDTAWFSKSVQAILNDLEQAGMLRSRIDGKRKTFAITPRSSLWHPEFGKGLRWLNQGMFYTGILHVFNTLDAASNPSLSAAAQAIVIRRDLTPLNSAFHQAGYDSLFSNTRHDRGELLTTHFEEGCSHLIQLIETRAGMGTT